MEQVVQQECDEALRILSEAGIEDRTLRRVIVHIRNSSSRHFNKEENKATQQETPSEPQSLVEQISSYSMWALIQISKTV